MKRSAFCWICWLWLSLWGFLGASSLHAQLSVFPKAWSVSGGLGSLVAAPAQADPLRTGAIRCGELAWRYHFSGVKEWEKFHRYPYAGVALSYTSFRNPQLGSAFGMMATYGKALYRSRRLELNLRLGQGLAFINKPFDLENNRKNILYSTKLNFVSEIQLAAEWRLSPRLVFLTGLNWKHFSNYGFKIPNYGVNVAAFQTGFRANMGNPVAVNHNRFPILRRDWHLLIWTCGWLKEVPPVMGAKYWAQTLSVNILRRYSIGGLYGFGMDWMFDRSLQKRDPDLNFPLRGALTASYEFQSGNFYVPVQVGVYALDPFKGDDWVYFRTGCRFRIARRFIMNLTLKTHMARADYAELGFGYLLR